MVWKKNVTRESVTRGTTAMENDVYFTCLKCLKGIKVSKTDQVLLLILFIIIFNRELKAL